MRPAGPPSPPDATCRALFPTCLLLRRQLPHRKACPGLAPLPSALPVRTSQVIKQSIVELRLQAEDSFVLKVVQLEELLQVRHSVFVVGNAGSGKSQARPPPPAEAPPPAPNPHRRPRPFRTEGAGVPDSAPSPTPAAPAHCVLGGPQPEICRGLRRL